MYKNNLLTVKKHPVSTMIAGIVMGVLVSTPVLAVTSLPTATVIGHIPVITGGVVTVKDTNQDGLVDEGDVLTIAESSLNFTDSDGDVKDTTVPYSYSWQVGGTEAETKNSYTIQKKDLGKSITLNVIGHTNSAITDPTDSSEVSAKFASNATLSINGTPISITVASGDEPVSVAIAGLDSTNRPVVGVKLTANATCVGGACGTLKYQWQKEDAVGSNIYTTITGATTQEYIPRRDDQKKHIKVTVTK